MTGRPKAIVGGRLLDPAGGLDGPGGVLMAGGTIQAIGPSVTREQISEAYEIIDAAGCCVAPGLVDMRVHFGEPGAEHKETFDSGSAAALAGGVTSVALLPDTEPVVDDPAMVEYVARRARRAQGVKVYPYGGLTRGLAGEQLAEIGLLLQAGAVAFTDGSTAVANSRVLARALAYTAQFDALVVQRPEDPTLAPDGLMNEGPVANKLGLAGRPAVAEVIMVERDLRLLAMTGGRYHIAQISTRAAVDAVRKARDQGLDVTCDVSPHHLLLNELDVEGYRTFAKVMPPLRAEDDRQAMVEALADGTIDVVASDHRPQDQDSKRLPFAQAEPGVVGVETMLPACLKLYHEGRIDLLTLLRRLTVAPAELLGLDAGKLKPGAPADLVVFDLERGWKLADQDLSSLAKNTAFEGRLFEGQVLRTLVDGRDVFQRRELVR